MGASESAREKFEEWQACRSELNRKTHILQKEMDEFLAGNGPAPTELLADVLGLQKRCVKLFDDVVKAMNTP